jgi:hypothetical protein
LYRTVVLARTPRAPVRSSGSCATLTPVPGPTFVCKGLPAAERRSGASICAVIRAPVDSIHRESSGLAELGVFALERQVRSTRRHIVRSRIRRRCAPEGCPTAAGTEPNGTGCGACRSRVQLTASRRSSLHRSGRSFRQWPPKATQGWSGGQRAIHRQADLGRLDSTQRDCHLVGSRLASRRAVGRADPRAAWPRRADARERRVATISRRPGQRPYRTLGPDTRSSRH